MICLLGHWHFARFVKGSTDACGELGSRVQSMANLWPPGAHSNIAAFIKVWQAAGLKKMQKVIVFFNPE